MNKRSHHYEKMARVYDDEILPVWTERFGALLMRGLVIPPKAMVLDVGCGTGYVSQEILRRMDEHGRIIAIDANGLLLDVARQKVGAVSGKRIFFRTEPPLAKLTFADDVYDLVLSNVGLLTLDDPPRGLQEFSRVTKPGGKVIFTLPLAGTYEEFYDIYREVLTKNDLDEVLERLEQHIIELPDAEEVQNWMERAGLQEINIEEEQFTLLFKSSREFFFSPVIEFGPLSTWKAVAGKGKQMQEIFWHIKQAIDTYFQDRAFEITVKMGCCRGTKPGAPASDIRQNTGEIHELLPVPQKPNKPSLAAAETVECAVPSLKDNFLLDDEDDDEEGSRR